ncbi:MAG TPA: EamA family transporter [Candidatus Limnocylindrales bacterium]|jgi:drug/metabolite transporter (DMT)-like permease
MRRPTFPAHTGPAEPRQPPPTWLVWAALLVVYLVWGSTYLAIAYVVQSMPPLLAAAFRFFSAGALLAAVLVLRRGPRVLRLSRAELAGASFVGLALLLGGNGMVMLGQREVPSGLAALIIAVVPLWVIVLRLLFAERVRRGTLAGVALGFAGVAVLVAPRGLTGEVPLGGMLLLIAAGASWASGSYLSRRLRLPRDPFVSTAAQLVAGGLGLAVVGLLVGEAGLLAGAHFSTASMLGLGYLILFGSILAYTAYTWLLQHAPVSQVATYAYVNPVVAIALGSFFLHEAIDLGILVGGAMIVVAVGLVIRTEARPVAPSRLVAAR